MNIKEMEKKLSTLIRDKYLYGITEEQEEEMKRLGNVINNHYFGHLIPDLDARIKELEEEQANE